MKLWVANISRTATICCLTLKYQSVRKWVFWGERRRKYLREHQQALYTAMMLSDTLNVHLDEVDRTATEMYDRLTSQLAAQEGIAEQLKATNQMEWIQQMNNIRNRAAEVVWKELICV